jgi:hypothetical protein
LPLVLLYSSEAIL